MRNAGSTCFPEWELEVTGVASVWAPAKQGGLVRRRLGDRCEAETLQHLHVLIAALLHRASC